jgi:hypothetical protein
MSRIEQIAVISNLTGDVSFSSEANMLAAVWNVGVPPTDID